MQQLYIERLKGSVSNKMSVYQSLVYIYIFLRICNQKICKALNLDMHSTITRPPAIYMDW